MQYDQLLTYLGDFGRYQKVVYVLLWFTVMPHAFHVCNVLFWTEEPVSRCAVPGFDNDTFAIQNEAHQKWVNASIPFNSATGRYSKCKIFADHQNESDVNEFRNKNTIRCDRWVYDTNKALNSIFPDLAVTCDSKSYRVQFGLCIMCGLLAGSLLGGLLSDYFGRKRTLIIAFLLHVIVDIAYVFVTSPIVALIVKFVQTTLGVILLISKFVLIVELIGPGKRGMAAMATMYAWSLPMCYSSLLYYLCRDWKTAQLILSVPFIVCIPLMRFVPESPRWLMVNHKIPEAKEILRKMAKTNKVALPESILESLEILNLDDIRKKAFAKHGMFQLFNSKIMIVRLIILSVNWGVINIAYYGMTLNIGILTRSNIYLNTLIQGIAETLIITACIVTSKWLGRKMSYCLNMFFGGGVCLVAFVLGVAYTDDHWINLALFHLGKMGVGGAFVLIFTVTAELIPTASRNFGLGLCSLSGRILGLLAPYIGNMGTNLSGPIGQMSPLLVFGVISILAGLSITLVPETNNQRLQESIVEVRKGKKTAESAEEEIPL